MPRPPSISPELMSTFVTVVRAEGDATRAAEILNINQPSMSKRLAFLQHSGRVLRKPWLERVGKTWKLTEEGRRVLPAVEELVHRYRLLTEALEESRPSVVFSCDSGSISGFVHEAVRSFRARNPNASFRMSTLTPAVRVEGVANGSLDIATTRLAEEEILELARRPLFVEELFDDPLVLVASPNVEGYDEFEALTERAISPKSLMRFPLIVPAPDSGLRREFDRRCRDAGVLDRLRIVVEAGPWHAVAGYIRDGAGVGVVPASVAAEWELAVKPLPIKLTPANTIRVICRKRAGMEDLDLSAQANAFLIALREASRSVQSGNR